MYPKTLFGPYGYDPLKGRFPLERISSLGFITSALRRPTVAEKWSPYEIAVFEGALALYGKNFHQVRGRGRGRGRGGVGIERRG